MLLSVSACEGRNYDENDQRRNSADGDGCDQRPRGQCCHGAPKSTCDQTDDNQIEDDLARTKWIVRHTGLFLLALVSLTTLKVYHTIGNCLVETGGLVSGLHDRLVFERVEANPDNITDISKETAIVLDDKKSRV